MHESPACFCFAFDRERHFKPEVIGRHSSWLAIHRRCQCQEGELNEMKRLLKKRCSGFAGRKGHVPLLSWAWRGWLGGIGGSKRKAVPKPNSLGQDELRGLSALPLAQVRRCRSGRKVDEGFGAERGMWGRAR